MGYELVAWGFTGLAAILMVLLPRRSAIIPLFFVAYLLPLAQQVQIVGLNFPMSRLLILVGAARLLLQSAARPGRLGAIDKAMLVWWLSAILSYTLLWQTGSALINRMGIAYDALGIFFLVKGFVADTDDVDRVMKAFVIISALVAAAMLVENATGRNAFAVFGGVPVMTEVRLGRLRAQGAFMHPIMAGTFGASLFPLFVSLGWGGRKHKMLGLFGAAAATIITITSASSTPLLGYAAGIVALCMWPLRNHMRPIRWGMLFAVIGLHLVMKAPVWSLIGRIDVVGGNTAYHRQYLVDQFMNRVGEWGLLGTKSTEHWGPSFLVMHDLTNQFVAVGVQGGLLTLVAFIVVIGLCFRGVGRARRAFGSQNEPDREKLCWAFGASMVVHLTAFMGSSYFDQMVIVWYTDLAIIAVLTSMSEQLVASPTTQRTALHLGTSSRPPLGARGLVSAPHLRG